MTPKTSLGFECIDFAEQTLELELMPWQKWFLIHALELHPTEVDDYGDPVFRFRKVILLVGRQNGKSTVMQALTLWRMYIDRCSLVIGTAQDLEVAESLWAESLEMAEETEELKVEIGKIERQPGRKKFKLRSGEEYKVKAASRRGGRGLSGELVLLDELREHQSWDAWGAVTKTTNAKARAQVYGISNAGDATSIVLRYLRKTAHAELGDPDGINSADAQPAEDLLGDEIDDIDDIDSGLAIFEWSATPGADIMDRDQWALANPSLGYRIRETTLASDAKTDPEWVFRTECLCQWSDGTLEGPFPPGSWDAGRWDKDAPNPPQIVGNVMACVDMSQDRIKTYVAFAGRQADGSLQVELVAERAGSEWVAEWLRERADVVDAVTGQTRGAPVSSLMADLKTALDGVIPVVDLQGSDLTSATGRFYDLVREHNLTHNPWPSLDLAAATAVPKLTEGGAFMWDRKRSPVDVAPLQAATGAVWLLTKPDEAKFTSAYADHDLIVI